ncbi:MAG: hypothetical protein AB1715_12910, partial [Acidobacteriota bacterium]
MDKSKPWMAELAVVLAIVVLPVLEFNLRAQKVETVDGVRVVHNRRGGRWGKSPQLSLKPVMTLGELEAKSLSITLWT